MYTRNQGSVRPTPVMHGTVPPIADRVTGDGNDSGGMPYLIPQDYRGEFLRGHRTPPEDTAEPDSQQTEKSTQAESIDRPSEDIEPAPAEVEHLLERTVISGETSGRGASLLGGLYDLLLGENSSEEETLLLLGIALLLLWGHLDRGGLFDRTTWDADDLALLLIGYLLLS